MKKFIITALMLALCITLAVPGVELNYLSAFVNGYNALQQPVKHAFQPVSLKRKRAYCAAERA